jgi:hypothetical protein
VVRALVEVPKIGDAPATQALLDADLDLIPPTRGNRLALPEEFVQTVAGGQPEGCWALAMSGTVPTKDSRRLTQDVVLSMLWWTDERPLGKSSNETSVDRRGVPTSMTSEDGPPTGRTRRYGSPGR